MITDKDVADKRNEVMMLRSQIAEHKARRRLNEIEQLELNDVLPSRNELTDRLESAFAVNRQQEDTIDTYKDAVASQNKVLKDFQDEINKKDTTIKEMKSKVEPPNLAVMVLLHNLNAKTEALEADLSNSKSAIMMKNGVINDRNETISDLRMAASDMLDTINKCSRREAEDSRVLMQVVEAIRDNSPIWWTLVVDIVEDYLNAPEPPVVTLKAPSMGTRVVSKNEETLFIDENKMAAVRMLVDGGDNWVVSTDMDAIEVMEQKETIDELKDFIREQGGCVDDRDKRIEQLMVLNEALRVDIELAHNLSCDHIADKDRTNVALLTTLGLERTDHTAEMSAVKKTLHDTIKGVKTELDARNQVIKDFKAIEQKETDRLHTVIEGNGKIIDELNDMYCDACGKLEKIEKIAEHPAYDCFSTALDEIIKIIQEE